MKVLMITGAGGFLGQCFTDFFADSRQIVAVGRKAVKGCEHVSCDLSVEIPNLPDLQYDTLIHNAGLAHNEALKKSHPEQFFQVNVEGTRNLLLAVKKLSSKPERIVFISSVAVYGCEEGTGIDEMHPLNGKDPYARSKIEAEELLLSYCRAEDIPCFILRLPLIIGKHHKGNMRRLIDSIRNGRYLGIKDNPALKSMVLASDVANQVNQLQGKPPGIYHLTDRKDHRINELEDILSQRFGKKLIKIPPTLIRLACGAGSLVRLIWKGFPIHLGTFRKLTNSLTFSSERAVTHLQWKPNDVSVFLQQCPLEEL